MENPKSNLIKEIAQELDCGNDCYYNSETDEIIAIPNFSNISDEDEFRECFKADLKKIKTNKADIIKIEVLESFESFKIMERFIDQISDTELKMDLENKLQRKKHFRILRIQSTIRILDKNGSILKKLELEKIVETRLNQGKASAQHCI